MGFTDKARDKMAEMSDRMDEVRSKREAKKAHEDGEEEGGQAEHGHEEDDHDDD